MFETKSLRIVLFFGVLALGGSSVDARPTYFATRKKMVEGVEKKALVIGIAHTKNKAAGTVIEGRFGRVGPARGAEEMIMIDDQKSDSPDYLQEFRSFVEHSDGWVKKINFLTEGVGRTPEGYSHIATFENELLRCYEGKPFAGPFRLVRIDDRAMNLSQGLPMCSQLVRCRGSFDAIYHSYDRIDCGRIGALRRYVHESLESLSPADRAKFNNSEHPLYIDLTKTRGLRWLCDWYRSPSGQDETVQEFVKRIDGVDRVTEEISNVKLFAKAYHAVFNEHAPNLVFFRKVQEALSRDNEVVILCGETHARAVVKALEADAYQAVGEDRVEQEDEDRIPACVWRDQLQNFYSFCYVCGETATQRCATCKIARYCSRECQTEDWPSHKTHHKSRHRTTRRRGRTRA